MLPEPFDALRGGYQLPPPMENAPTPRWHKLRFHPLQLRVIREAWRYRYVCLPCGRRSGKTELAKRFVVTLAQSPHENVDRRYGVGAPTHDQAGQIYWSDLKALSSPWLIDDISESDRIIKYITGAMIQVMGLDKPQRMEGRPWDGWLLDEFADMKADVLNAHVRPALADRGGFLWVYGVPEGRNHFWELWLRAQTDERWLALTWSARTVLRAQEIESLTQDMDERTIAQEIDASFVEVKGRIYYAFDREKNVVEFGLKKPDTEWCIGMDFNVEPLCAVIFFEQDDVTYVWDEYVVHTANTYEVGQQIKNDGIYPANAYPDPTGRGRHTASGRDVTDISILRNLGFRVYARAGSPSRRARYNALNSRLCNAAGQRRLLIHPRCKHLIKCLDGQAYPDGRSEEDSKDPLGHINAALGYPVEYLHPVRAVGGGAETGKF